MSDRWSWRFAAGSRVEVVAVWACPGDVTLRVVRWVLRGRERALYRWARDGTDERHTWEAGAPAEAAA